MSYFKKTAAEYIREGNNRILLGDFKTAILEFTKAIIENPMLPQAYTCRAQAKFEIRDYKGAIADCQTALKLHFKADVELEKRWKGMAEINKDKKANPIYGKIYSIIGTCKLLLGEVEDGFVDLNSARLLGYSDAADIIKAYAK